MKGVPLLEIFRAVVHQRQRDQLHIPLSSKLFLHSLHQIHDPLVRAVLEFSLQKGSSVLADHGPDFLLVSPINRVYDIDGNVLVMMPDIIHHLSDGHYTGNDRFTTALRESISGWHLGNNDYAPFTVYFLRHLSLAFQYFFYRLLPLGGRDRKAKCIKALFRDESVLLTKSEIHDLCYEISVPTIESVLGKLSGETGFLEKVGKGRNTAYRRRAGAIDLVEDFAY